MPADRPATLAAWLRTRSDAQLAALLAARPDVARPAPSDVVALASRLAVPVSVDRALDDLDAATLQVLDVVLLAPTDGIEAADVAAALPGVPDDVPDDVPDGDRPDGVPERHRDQRELTRRPARGVLPGGRLRPPGTPSR